jgi:tetratricopeptide (TPR) repeat protein
LGDIDPESNPERSKEPYRRSLDLARQWAAASPGRESRTFLSRAMLRLSYVSSATGDLAGALVARTSALQIVDQLLLEQPANEMLQFRRNGICRDIGRVTGHPEFFNLGDRKGAAIWIHEALDGYARMSAADPDDVSARAELANTSADLAEVIGDRDPAEAERLLRRSLVLNESARETTPHDTDLRDAQANARIAFASVLRRLGKTREGLAEQEKGLEALDGLHAENPGHLDIGLDLCEALDRVAEDRVANGDTDAARRYLERSLGILEPLFRANPRSLFALRDLADCHQGFGDLAACRSDWKTADAEYRKSLDLWDQWKQIGTSSVYDRSRRDALARLVARASRKSSRNSPTR